MVNSSLDMNYVIKFFHSCKVRNEFDSIVDISWVSLEDLRNRKIRNERRFALLTTVVQLVIADSYGQLRLVRLV